MSHVVPRETKTCDEEEENGKFYWCVGARTDAEQADIKKHMAVRQSASL